MKTKIVLLLFLFGASVSSLFAQENGGRSAKSMEFNKRLQQGHYTVATNFTYGWGTRTNEWLGTAQLGYFLTDHWVGGIQLGLGGSKVDLTPIFAVDPNYDLKSGTTASYIPELYTRYYFLNSRFRPFVQVSAGYTRTNTKETRCAV